jgi:hypothetical protein
MKKQLIIAAVAATMSVSALADISITGAASATFTATDFDASGTANTNRYAQDTDITITGTHGDTTVTASIDLSDTGNAAVGEIAMKTTLMGVDITITDDTNTTVGVEGTNIGTELIAVTTIAGVTLTFEDSNANKNGSLKAAMTIAGLDVSHKQAQTSKTTEVGGDMGGITATYKNVANQAASADTSSIVVSGSAGGVDLTVSSFQADASAAAWLDKDGDSAAASESNNGTEIKATMDLGGNSVTVTSSNFSQNSTAKVDKLTIAGTRALASGADLTATFTNDDVNNKSSVALKIAVSF